MDSSQRRREVGRFLRERRGRVLPADVGLAGTGRRRVPGLRREEVATLAGVGVTWYTMLENGSALRPSPETLAAVARALQLTPDECRYLYRLAEERAPTISREDVTPLTLGALGAIEWAPAYVCTVLWDVLAWNRAMSVVWGIDPPGGEPFNIVERTFRDAAFRGQHGPGFPVFARHLVAMVRSASAAQLESPRYRQLCDGLRSDPLFAAAWDAYDIATPLGTFATAIESERVGAFAYRALTLDVPDDDGHFIVIQVPDAPSDARLRRAMSAGR
jgi:transcriptional regulator with XRE-family HTH domain